MPDQLARRARAEDQVKVVGECEQLEDVLRHEGAVGLGQHDVLAAGLCQSAAQGVAVALAWLAHHAGTGGFGPAGGRVARVVVDYHDLVDDVEAAEVGHRRGDRRLFVVSGKHDAHRAPLKHRAKGSDPRRRSTLSYVRCHPELAKDPPLRRSHREADPSVVPPSG